jgi:hypothetical protein
MKLLGTISIKSKPSKKIELYHGDLTSLREDEFVDLLVVSAFPNDYSPTPTSLIGALYKKGLSVKALSLNKDIDLRKNYSCWLSNKFIPQNQELQFNRILCFEPLVHDKPPEQIGDIFRALTPILGENPEISTIAMPLVAAGDQGYSTEEIIVPLLDAAINWLEKGLPLNCIRIVAHSDSDAIEANIFFSQQKINYEKSEPELQSDMEYNVFISYSRENGTEMGEFEKYLKQKKIIF